MTGSIGRYQLENLVRNGIPFILFDLRQDRSIHDRLLDKANITSLSELITEAKKLASDERHPILLLCDQDEASREAQAVLEGAGFINVYFIRDGSRGLTEEEL